MRIAAIRLPVRSVRDRGLIRLIPEKYRDPPVLRALVDGDEEAAALDEFIGETDALRIAEREGGPALDRRELVFARRAQDLRLYGQTQINAAFAYARPAGNRFNGGDRGAWYCSYEVETSIREVGFHRTRELGHVGVFEDEARYVELLADIIGDFPDLDGRPEHPALNPDTDIGYPAGQALALDLRREGFGGLLYPSVRRRCGRCFAAFDPGIVQNVRPGNGWKLAWTGAPDYSVDRV